MTLAPFESVSVLVPSTCAKVAEPAEASAAGVSDSATAVFVVAVVSVLAVSAVVVSLAVLVSLQAATSIESEMVPRMAKNLFI